MRICCRTRYDITATGIKSAFNKNRLPIQDAQGDEISDAQSWNRARNRQRNWETINQIIALRTLPQDVSVPEKTQHDGQTWWQFGFEVESPGTVELDGDPVGVLVFDSQDVPMLTGLDEDAGVASAMEPGSNIVFWVDNDK